LYLIIFLFDIPKHSWYKQFIKRKRRKEPKKVTRKMCIIAIKPANIVIPSANITAMWENNPHGAGFMYAERGKVKVVKGFMKLNALMSALEEHKSRKLVMHFRTKTHGDISADLTHPFWVKKNGLAMVHNGIIWSFAKNASNKESDSLLYARHLGKRFHDPMEALTNPLVHANIVDQIGYSKLVFMDGNGDTQIVNEKLGTWDNGVWYSNSGFTRSYGWSGYYKSSTWSNTWPDDADGSNSEFDFSSYATPIDREREAAADAKEEALLRARREAEYQALFAEFEDKVAEDDDTAKADGFTNSDFDYKNF
jgi:hypothetical protein